MAIDNAPVGNTCPIIDTVLTDLAYVLDQVRTSEYLVESSIHNSRYEVAEEISKTHPYIDNIKTNMEEIRQANSALRGWGNDLHALLTEAEEAKDELNSQLDTAGERVLELEAMLKISRAQIEALEWDLQVAKDEAYCGGDKTNL